MLFIKSNESNQQPHPHINDHYQLKRSISTPSLKRCWLCQSCKLLNNSVTWHCLNCECVSFIAPIYKDTLQKGSNSSNTTDAPIAPINNHDKIISKPIKSILINSVSNRKSLKSAITKVAMNHIDANNSNNYSTKHGNDAADSNNCSNDPNSIGDCYIKQFKYNEVTRYQPNNNLCLLKHHHRLENKSLPNIVDAFSKSDMMSQEYSDHLFGERVFTVNKANAFCKVQPNGKSFMRKALTPTHEIHQFTRFATKSAARESVVKKMCTPGEACRMCNLNKYVKNENMPMNMNDTSRFTITTLSRKHSFHDGDKNHTLSRNAGVLIAVRDWSKVDSTENQNNDIFSIPLSSPDSSYYERLRNPNNNITSNLNKESDCSDKMPTKICENNRSIDMNRENGPIYAVVNKTNKTKNQQSSGIRTPTSEQTKFTYIGISPSNNVKVLNSATETDSLCSYATIKSSQYNDNHSNNNTVALSNAITNLNSVNNNINNGIAVNECASIPASVNAEFSTKVWKGAKKPIEPHKM